MNTTQPNFCKNPIKLACAKLSQSKMKPRSSLLHKLHDLAIARNT